MLDSARGQVGSTGVLLGECSLIGSFQLNLKHVFPSSVFVSLAEVAGKGAIGVCGEVDRTGGEDTLSCKTLVPMLSTFLAGCFMMIGEDLTFAEETCSERLTLLSC